MDGHRHGEIEAVVETTARRQRARLPDRARVGALAHAHVERGRGGPGDIEKEKCGISCVRREVDSDEQIAAYIKESISTWFHPVGTCRMGVGDNAVVAPNLAVHGTTGLYVADASIMPDIVSVNTNAASMMIGWHASDLLTAR